MAPLPSATLGRLVRVDIHPRHIALPPGPPQDKWFYPGSHPHPGLWGPCPCDRSTAIGANTGRTA